MINPSGARGTARFARAVTAFTASLAVAGCSTSDTGEPGPRVTGAAIGVEGAHEHGVVRMGLAVDGTRLTLDMEAPGEAVFGFEHAPSSEEERSTVVQALERIRGEAGSLVSLSAALECSTEAVEILEAPDPAAPAAEDGAGHDHDAESDHDHGGEADGDHDPDDHDDEGIAHSEVRFTVTWTCVAELEQSSATLQVGRLLPDVERVDLTVITSEGQAGARVAPDEAFRF